MRAKEFIVEKECKWHVSPSGRKTNMCPNDDDYEINYGKDAADIEEEFKKIHPHQKKVEHFINWASNKLHLKESPPRVIFSTNTKLARSKHRTGYYNEDKNIVYVYTGHRNLVDIFRTLAHELTHKKQGEEGRIKQKSPPGSPNEKEADDTAGLLMKLYTKQHPDIIDGNIKEGWKDWVAGAAMGAAALGAAGSADAATNKQVSKPGFTHTVKQPQKIAPPVVSKKELAKSVTGNPHEVYLKKAALKAGIQGQELIAFLSQCAHETMDFKHMKEIGGKLDFKKYDPRFAPRKAKILGNDKAGDGAKYKGRGYIQITGKYNYEQAGKALGLDLVRHPELVEKPEIAAKVAVWYWQNRVAPKVDSFKNTQDVTKKINPGLKHLDQRKDKQKAFQIAMR